MMFRDWFIGIFQNAFGIPSDNFERSLGVNFDWYFPKYDYVHTPQEVKKWFNDVSLKIIRFDEIKSGISVTGIKL